MDGFPIMARVTVGFMFGLATALVPLAAHAQETDAAPQIVAPPQAFDILAIDVVGVTQLRSGEIERIVYPFMGPGRTPADVESARKAIQDAYAQAGFEAVAVEVPPQPEEEFARGVVRIAVAEAPVGAVSVTGSKHHSAMVLLRQLPSLRAGKPLNFQEFQRELAVANRFPDREVVPAFDAGTVPATIDVNLQVRDEFPLHGTIELNNDHSPNTTPLRLSGSVRYTNLWELGHTVTFGGVVAPERRSDTEAVFGSYTWPVLGSPWTFIASGYKSNSNIASLGGTNVLGNGYQVGVQALYRLPSERDYHAFRVGVDYKDFKQDIGLQGSTISSAPIRYIPLLLGYNFSAARDKSALDVGLTTTLGLRVLKRIDCFDPTATVCTPEDQFTNREVDSIENFAHVNLDATYTRSYPGDWVSEVRLSAQYADSHLVSNEQFAAGGLSTVRGYYQSEVVGDRGLAATLELRGPSLATYLGTFVDEMRVFAFADGGIVSIIDPLPDQLSTFKIASFGGGVRLKVLGILSGELVVAVPARATLDTEAHDPRFTFTVKGEY